MTHRLIYADPAWSYNDKARARIGAERHYPTCTMAEIAMHIEIEGKPDPEGCYLACWQTWPMERAQDALLEGLGWKKITLLLLWLKVSKEGEPRMLGGHYSRANTEPCFLWRRGCKGLPKVVDKGVRQVMRGVESGWDPVIVSQLQAHSRKPIEARHRLERIFGDVPRIELYARGRVPGWKVWGNQAVES